MEPAENSAPSKRLKNAIAGAPRATSPRQKASNTYTFREEWLSAAKELLRPMFEKAGANFPDFARAAIGFTSKGGKGNCVGECWHSSASGDNHFEIFIRPDHADPVEVLGILTHELVHACVPIGSGHGPIYKALALKIGLEGKMRHAMPGMHLVEVLKGIADQLGPLPHASLNLQWRETAPRRKQKTNLLKAFCEGVKDDAGKVTEACDYVCRVTAVHAKKGAPICGVHGVRMMVEWPVEEESEGEEGETEGSPDTDADGFKAPDDLPPAPVETLGEGSDEPGPDGFKASPASPAETYPPGFRPVLPDEIHPPGHTFQLHMATGEKLVSEVPNAG